MPKTSHEKTKRLEDEEEDIYEDDFEQCKDDDVEDIEEYFRSLDLDKAFLPEENYVESSTGSFSPCSDSAGESLNTKERKINPSLLPSYDDTDIEEFFRALDRELGMEAHSGRIGGKKYNSSFELRHFSSSLDGVCSLPPRMEKKYKNGTRASLTFSNERVKEINRTNDLLLKKIMRHRCAAADAGQLQPPKQGFSFNSQRPIIKSTAEINRRKKQREVERNNGILTEKIRKIASRRRPLSSTFG